jgi:hypothetical protein
VGDRDFTAADYDALLQLDDERGAEGGGGGGWGAGAGGGGGPGATAEEISMLPTYAHRRSKLRDVQGEALSAPPLQGGGGACAGKTGGEDVVAGCSTPSLSCSTAAARTMTTTSTTTPFPTAGEAPPPPPLADADPLFYCCVCLDRFEEGETLRVLPCLHQFHDSCVSRWLVVKAICPVCNVSIRDPVWSAV